MCIHALINKQSSVWPLQHKHLDFKVISLELLIKKIITISPGCGVFSPLFAAYFQILLLYRLDDHFEVQDASTGNIFVRRVASRGHNLFSRAEREHSAAHRLPGRTERSCQAPGEERSRHQLAVPSEERHIQHLSSRCYLPNVELTK